MWLPSPPTDSTLPLPRLTSRYVDAGGVLVPAVMARLSNCGVRQRVPVSASATPTAIPAGPAANVESDAAPSVAPSTIPVNDAPSRRNATVCQLSGLRAPRVPDASVTIAPLVPPRRMDQPPPWLTLR